jgi:hypothetical protein
MTEEGPQPDQLTEALKYLATTKDDNFLALMAREINLYFEALVTRGNRSMMDHADMRVVLHRAVDIASIKPRHRPASIEPNSQVDTEKLAQAIGRPPVPLKPVPRG